MQTETQPKTKQNISCSGECTGQGQSEPGIISRLDTPRYSETLDLVTHSTSWKDEKAEPPHCVVLVVFLPFSYLLVSDLYSQIPKAYDGPKTSVFLPDFWFLFPVVVSWSNCRTGFLINTDFCQCGLPILLGAEAEWQALMKALVTARFQLVLPINMKVPWNKLPLSENRTDYVKGSRWKAHHMWPFFLALCPFFLFIPGCTWDQSNGLRTLSAAEKTGKPRKPFVIVNEGTQKQEGS